MFCRYPADPFQSTPSVGRATSARKRRGIKTHISIHALRGEGDASCAHDLTNNKSFQSTPSVGRATAAGRVIICSVRQFQSTPSVGRATLIAGLFTRSFQISIHALRGEGDIL